MHLKEFNRGRAISHHRTFKPLKESFPGQTLTKGDFDQEYEEDAHS